VTTSVHGCVWTPNRGWFSLETMAAPAAQRRPATLRRAAELGGIELIAVAVAVAALAQPAPQPAVLALAPALAMALLLSWLRAGRQGYSEKAAVRKRKEFLDRTMLISPAAPIRAKEGFAMPQEPRVYDGELWLPSAADEGHQVVEPLPVPSPALDLAPAWVAEPPPIAAPPPSAGGQSPQGARGKLQLDSNGLPEFIPR
jgi:hypothetical protein